jgi:hypothetical protein
MAFKVSLRIAAAVFFLVAAALLFRTAEFGVAPGAVTPGAEFGERTVVDVRVRGGRADMLRRRLALGPAPAATLVGFSGALTRHDRVEGHE